MLFFTYTMLKELQITEAKKFSLAGFELGEMFWPMMLAAIASVMLFTVTTASMSWVTMPYLSFSICLVPEQIGLAVLLGVFLLSLLLLSVSLFIMITSNLVKLVYASIKGTVEELIEEMKKLHKRVG